MIADPVSQLSLCSSSSSTRAAGGCRRLPWSGLWAHPSPSEESCGYSHIKCVCAVWHDAKCWGLPVHCLLNTHTHVHVHCTGELVTVAELKEKVTFCKYICRCTCKIILKFSAKRKKVQTLDSCFSFCMEKQSTVHIETFRANCFCSWLCVHCMLWGV